MFKGVMAFCAVLSLFACASPPDPISSSPPPEIPDAIDLNHWITVPKQNEIIIVGVSNYLTRREAEITNAREDAARKASMYSGVQARVTSSVTYGSFLDYSSNSDVTVEYDQYEQYLDKLSFDPEHDIYTRNNAVFIRFTYPVNFSANISYDYGKNSNGSPQWTTSPPNEINGFLAGVGFSRRQSRVRDTVTKSVESAVGSLVSRLFSSVRASETATSTQGSTSVFQQSRGRLTNFIILEIWIDPDTDAVWTLAIASAGTPYITASTAINADDAAIGFDIDAIKATDVDEDIDDADITAVDAEPDDADAEPGGADAEPDADGAEPDAAGTEPGDAGMEPDEDEAEPDEDGAELNSPVGLETGEQYM